MNDWGPVWQRVVGGETVAFELVVARHQNVVSAVAFSIVGDFAASQDVAQETFWTAWRTREQLREPEKLTAWLCGIARNIARQWRRRSGRQPTASFADAAEPVSDTSPADALVSAEEQSLVWDTLRALPDSYREVLVLFYREGHSIADVANALELSEDAVKQRLHRGREMIRAQLADVIENTLVRTRPGRRFTARVMTGLTAVAALKSAPASAATTTAVAAGGASVGLLGGIVGMCAGWAGAWLGMWVPAQLAPTQTERRFLEQQGRRILWAALVFSAISVIATAVLMIRPDNTIHRWVFITGLAMALAGLLMYVVAHVVYVNRRIRAIRSHVAPDEDRNDSPWKTRLEPLVNQGPRAVRIDYRSRWSLFRWPLLAIQIGTASDADTGHPRVEARGWIAIGDRACGLIMAVGGVARGLIAFGGIAVGGLAIGGAAIGVLACGGGALGLVAVGGLSVGWDAVGGLAVGWNSAVGGFALAYHVAFGGGAIAHDFAIGGGAWAEEVNTPVAQDMADRESLKWLMDWYVHNRHVAIMAIIFVSIAPWLVFLWMSRWKR